MLQYFPKLSYKYVYFIWVHLSAEVSDKGFEIGIGKITDPSCSSTGILAYKGLLPSMGIWTISPHQEIKVGIK